mmetsp:Transcript_31054/g.97990  ORF Transcript_31054/g.97990 Transcript_31054/m.97990 type:complete len:236 (-) Transcript_31054:192-899(-)
MGERDSTGGRRRATKRVGEGRQRQEGCVWGGADGMVRSAKDPVRKQENQEKCGWGRREEPPWTAPGLCPASRSRVGTPFGRGDLLRSPSRALPPMPMLADAREEGGRLGRGGSVAVPAAATVAAVRAAIAPARPAVAAPEAHALCHAAVPATAVPAAHAAIAAAAAVAVVVATIAAAIVVAAVSSVRAAVAGACRGRRHGHGGGEDGRRGAAGWMRKGEWQNAGLDASLQKRPIP